ncbi:hypothetical protein Q1695_012043 [Nippostrongylus brasiliensis]|nr:hypothetical protein Q1695_012043 [Nippostrongylus brasiliensis]
MGTVLEPLQWKLSKDIKSIIVGVAVLLPECAGKTPLIGVGVKGFLWLLCVRSCLRNKSRGRHSLGTVIAS